MTANHAHTPTKAEIMDSYRRGRVWATPNGGRTYAAEFERWYKKVIAAAEQRGAIKALRDAEKVIDAELQDSPAPNYEEDNYDAGRIDGLTFSQEHLRNRADQMEGDDE